VKGRQRKGFINQGKVEMAVGTVEWQKWEINFDSK
jgi:hypothetical protein